MYIEKRRILWYNTQDPLFFVRCQTLSYFVQFLLILALVVLGCMKTTLQSAMGKRYVRCAQDSVLFNILFFVSISLSVTIIFGIGRITPALILWAAAVAVFTVMFQMLYAMALSMGPVSLTVLIINCNVFICTIASTIMFREQIYLPQLAAIGFLVISMLLSLKKSADGKGVSTRWLVLSLLAMTGAGVATTIQKAFSVSSAASADTNTGNTFLVVMYLIGALMLAVIYFVSAYTGKKSKSTAGIRPGMLVFALAMGVVMCIYQKVNIISMANIDGAFHYPTYTGLASVVMSLIGILFFRDQLNSRQKWGIVCGIVSVVLMNVRWMPL